MFSIHIYLKKSISSIKIVSVVFVKIVYIFSQTFSCINKCVFEISYHETSINI